MVSVTSVSPKKIFSSLLIETMSFASFTGVLVACTSGRSTLSPVMSSGNRPARAMQILLPAVFIGPAVIFLAYFLVLPAIRTFATSFFDQDGAAFVGDDVIDLPVMRNCGLAIAVANARAEVKQEADYVTPHAGGDGALRDAVEYILKAQGKWKQVVSEYISERSSG